MTEQDILTLQQQNGQTEFYLMLIGRFYHAYGNGAFALARVTGYQVRRVSRKAGELMVLGFPIDRFDAVRDRVRDAGGEIDAAGDKTWKFRGLDGTPDLAMVTDPSPKSSPGLRPATATAASGAAMELPSGDAHTAQGAWLEAAIRAFDLSTATPLDAMLFISQLKQRLQRQAVSSLCPDSG